MLILLAGILSVISGLPYMIDIARHKTHPNLVTWITWTLVSVINTSAAISDHAPHTAVLSGTIALNDAIIVVMSLHRGVKRYTGFDIACQILALLGVLLWLASGNPSLAVALSLTVIVIAALPTWRHAWLAPHEETWEGFAISALAGMLTLISLSHFTFVAVAFPIVILINSLTITGIILIRRAKMPGL